jgi:voltage-gated potassium channel Kch
MRRISARAAAWWKRTLEQSTTPIGAVRAIVVTTLLVVVAGGALINLLDHDEFPTFGSGVWWAAQTVTTVGYGDAVPHATVGRIVAVYVMVTGVAFVAIATAAISARLIESAHRRSPATDVAARLDEIAERLERIEASMHRRAA